MLFINMVLLTANSEKSYISGVGTLVGSFFMLVLVLVLAFLSIKFLGTRGRFSTKTRLIKVIDRVPVTADAHIVVVSVAEQTYLLGVTPGGITKLTELDTELCKTIISENTDTQFSDILKFAMGTIGKGEKKP